MSQLRFSWDPRKARSNERKHQVSFDEARSVFLDEEALLLQDHDHSAKEDRFVLLGLSSRLRFLVVSHTFREAQGVIRLISARKASKNERRQYDERYRR